MKYLVEYLCSSSIVIYLDCKRADMAVLALVAESNAHCILKVTETYSKVTIGRKAKNNTAS